MFIFSYKLLLLGYVRLISGKEEDSKSQVASNLASKCPKDDRSVEHRPRSIRESTKLKNKKPVSKIKEVARGKSRSNLISKDGEKKGEDSKERSRLVASKASKLKDKTTSDKKAPHKKMLVTNLKGAKKASNLKSKSDLVENNASPSNKSKKNESMAVEDDKKSKIRKVNLTNKKVHHLTKPHNSNDRENLTENKKSQLLARSSRSSKSRRGKSSKSKRKGSDDKRKHPRREGNGRSREKEE